MSINEKPVSLKLNKEFKRAYYRGKNKACPYFVCYLVKNRKEGLRYGITASKKLGNAVMRNRARRIIRAAFFSICDQFPGNYDLVIVAREKVLRLKSHEAAAVMQSCLEELTRPSSPKKSADEKK